MNLSYSPINQREPSDFVEIRSEGVRRQKLVSTTSCFDRSNNRSLESSCYIQ